MRVFNFSAGPAALPLPVLEQAAAEMLDWHGSGMSVMEMSHRGPEFMSIAAEAEADLRELLAVPANYKTLFLQGGAIAQNSAVPMNLMRGHAAADYVNTGEWSKRSIKEARKYGGVHVAASSEDKKFSYIPAQDTWDISADSAYVHICTNETIGGVEYHWVPDVGNVPLVADMSSHIMSRPVEIAKYGLIYAGAQKNMGTAGLTVVIVRDDLIGHALPITPSIMDYKAQADADWMLNTPSTYSVYIAGLVYKWLKAQGGLAVMEQKNIAKAKLLYDYLDSSAFFSNTVNKADRSRMNATFFLRDENLNEKFLETTKAAGMVQLKGHRIVGGMRASIYNAMPVAGIERLIETMRAFEAQFG